MLLDVRKGSNCYNLTQKGKTVDRLSLEWDLERQGKEELNSKKGRTTHQTKKTAIGEE